jgi:hypothetical protein
LERRRKVGEREAFMGLKGRIEGRNVGRNERKNERKEGSDGE